MRSNGNGPGYRPPSAKDGDPRFGGDCPVLIGDPWAGDDYDLDGD